jgi:DNA-binding transcriptional ArsR family regulator
MKGAAALSTSDVEDVWRALASPVRRRLLDLLRDGPRTTGDLVGAVPDLSRFAVMQHLGVLADADLILVRRRGRQRFNHLNPVPLRRWYERWVVPLADRSAADLLRLETTLGPPNGDPSMSTMSTTSTTPATATSTSATATSTSASSDTPADQVRAVRVEARLRFRATPDKVFRALTEDTLAWFPHTYGEDKVRSIVMEPRVGGAHYEDWGDGAGHLYGHVTVFDAPHRLGLRGRIMPGSILDTAYTIETDGDEAVLSMSKVAVGPMTDEEAVGIRQYGDINLFEDALRAVIEG